MSFNDPIADLLTRIRNATRAKRRYVDMDWSRMKESISQILKNEGFIDHFLIKKEKAHGTIRLFLRYGKNQQPAITGLKRVSKPGMRKYIHFEGIRPIFGGMGITILSTSKGVMAGKQAVDMKVGGEILCTVW